MPPDSFFNCNYSQEFTSLFAMQIREILEKVRELCSSYYEEKDNKLYVKKKVTTLKNE